MTAPAAAAASAPSPVSLFSLSWGPGSWSLSLQLSPWLVAAFAAAIVLLILLRWRVWGLSLKTFEIDQAEIGIGNQKLTFKPNLADRQIAYAIWVELSTRKIGLPVDFDNDVISEIYNSWYSYFSVTRDLIKGIPVSQIRRASTQAIITLSIEVLNQGMRPHLTRWQARFRHWYERQTKRYDSDPAGAKVPDPQQIQSEFPHYAELKSDMERVNQGLIRYRQKMYELVMAG